MLHCCIRFCDKLAQGPNAAVQANAAWRSVSCEWHSWFSLFPFCPAILNLVIHTDWQKILTTRLTRDNILNDTLTSNKFFYFGVVYLSWESWCFYWCSTSPLLFIQETSDSVPKRDLRSTQKLLQVALNNRVCLDGSTANAIAYSCISGDVTACDQQYVKWV